jgi:hypothetical protein
MPRWNHFLGVAALLLIFPATTHTLDQIFIATGSAWKYNATGTNLGTGWRTGGYSDASWPTGAAQLGYGDGDEATLLSFGGNTTNRYITYYFRRTFTVLSPASFGALSVRFVRDDGAVIYLNGVEVVRSNMPAGTISSTTLATTAIGGADESAWIEASIDPSLLASGTNVLAVEIHQQSATSSDISFDLELRATEALSPAPSVSLTSPTNPSVLNSTAVTFQASVSAPAGLTSAALYAGPPPQTAVFSGASQVQDAQITSGTVVADGSGASINVDGVTPHAHGLMKFPTLIGAGAGRVPAGAIINSATLQLNCTNPGNPMRLYRLTEDWVEDQATWTARATGSSWTSPGADGAGSNAGVALTGDCTTTGQRLIDVTRFVQEWSSGASNFGIVFIDSGSDGVDFSSSESTTSPMLTVSFKANLQPLATQAVSGNSADISFGAILSVGQTYFWNIEVTDTTGRKSWAPADFQLIIDTSVPDEPVAVTPLDGAAGVDPATALEAFVSDPGGGPLNVVAALRPAAPPEFTIIALPDTQHYSEAFPAIFTSQTQWIVDNKEARNIVFVTHEGDIVEHYNLTTEWDRANQSMSLLDGVVPYGMGPGNHDQPTTLYNQYFPYTRYQNQPWYGGHFQNLNDNNYQLFSAGGMDFVIVHLAFCPPTTAVSWADSIYKTYPNRIGIMTTHGYLNESAQRTVHGCTNTQYLWDGLAVPNPNLHFMLSGHVHDESRRIDVVNGHPVFQMLADFQDRASGGEGWLRILRFVPADGKIYVQTYSPWLNRFETDANSEFTLDFPMGASFLTAGSTTAQNESTATITPAVLSPNTKYEWRVTVTNSSGRSRTGPTWTFTTGSGGPINQPPSAQNQSAVVLEDTPGAITLAAADPEGAPLTYTVVNSPVHGTLSGVPPTLTYAPAANYVGGDTFTFRASDGVANSNTATVSVNIQPVNDPPIAANDTYSVQAAGTLTIGAPGILANDTDVDNATLSAALIAVPTHGAMTLAANGSFTYTPTAGFSGLDAFTYRASDGSLTSGVATVNVTVQPAPPPGPVTIFSADFNVGQDSFTYADNVFRGASQSNYASGSRISSGGFTGGALRVLLGGIDNNSISGMSGGWRRTFTLSAPAAVVLSFRYSLQQTADYESDEVSQMLASMDGVLAGTSPADYAAQVAGNGDGGSVVTTGWRLFQKALGTLPAGTHTVTLGGFNSKKTTSSEQTTILVDDVTLTVP